MLEELCRTAFWDACKDVSSKNYDLVRLKPSLERKTVEYKYRDFYEGYTYPRHNWIRCSPEAVHGRRDGVMYLTRQRSWTWFNEHANDLRDRYIKARYRGNIETAMDESGTFAALFEGFCNYFTERRNEFTKKTNEMIDQRAKELARMGKRPQSHGGVANLLKVLTKTMHEQGNSIYTIAMVQYQVCMQAGIYIPDEFLTDILVAGDMVKDV